MGSNRTGCDSREVSSICHLLHDIAFCVPISSAGTGLTCIHIQTSSGCQVRSQAVLEILLLILLLRCCCYILNGFPVSSVFLHSLAWRHPSRSSSAWLGCSLSTSFFLLLPLPASLLLLAFFSLQTVIRTAEGIKDLFRKWCFINTWPMGMVHGVQGHQAHDKEL